MSRRISTAQASALFSRMSGTPKDNRLARFHDAIRSLPSRGGGLHSALLAAANYGALAGLDESALFADLEPAARQCGADQREIRATVATALRDCRTTRTPSGRTTRPLMHAKPKPAIDAAATLQAILARGDGFTEAELWEASPIQLDWPAEEDAPRTLEAIYPSAARLFAGGRCDAGPVRTVADWCAAFRAGAPVPEHLIPNPLTGQQGPTKDGKPSLRADACVSEYWCAVVEFDELPREQQIAFWAGCRLPVFALVDSGGKSIHGWVKIPGVTSAEQWARDVGGLLYQQHLIPLGVDATCRNPARLSRMPGHFRKEKARWQRVLFLAPGGKAVLP